MISSTVNVWYSILVGSAAGTGAVLAPGGAAPGIASVVSSGAPPLDALDCVPLGVSTGFGVAGVNGGNPDDPLGCPRFASGVFDAPNAAGGAAPAGGAGGVLGWPPKPNEAGAPSAFFGSAVVTGGGAPKDGASV